MNRTLVVKKIVFSTGIVGLSLCLAGVFYPKYENWRMAGDKRDAVSYLNGGGTESLGKNDADLFLQRKGYTVLKNGSYRSDDYMVGWGMGCHLRVSLKANNTEGASFLV